jgi:hypothetical protein
MSVPNLSSPQEQESPRASEPEIKPTKRSLYRNFAAWVYRTDSFSHQLIHARFPRALSFVDVVLGSLFHIVSHNAFNVIAGLVLIVLGVTGVGWVVVVSLGSTTTNKLPELVVQAIKDLDLYLAGKDEASLQEMFATREMFAANVRYERDRIIHYQETGDKNFNWFPDYAKDGTLTLDATVMGENLKKQGGGLTRLP